MLVGKSQDFFAAERVQPCVLRLHVEKHGYFCLDVLPGAPFMVCLLLFLELELDKVLIWILEMVPELHCLLVSNSRNPGALSNAMPMDHSCFCYFLVNAKCFLPFHSPSLEEKNCSYYTCFACLVVVINNPSCLCKSILLRPFSLHPDPF